MLRTSILIVTIAAAFLFGTYYALKPDKKYELPFYQYNKQTKKVEKYMQPFKELHTLGYFYAHDQNNQIYNLDSTAGKILVVDYFFVSCPGICKQMGEQMQRLYGKYESDSNLKILSFTSKPEEDSVSVLNSYAKRMKVTNHSKWKFLVGDKKMLYNLAKDELGILNEEEAEDEFVHTERFVLIDKNKYIRGYYDGTSETDVNTLMKDIELLKIEK